MRIPLTLAGTVLVLFLSGTLASSPAHAGLPVNAALNFDNTWTTQYRAGDKPQGGGNTCLSGWTCGAFDAAVCQFSALSATRQRIIASGTDVCWMYKTFASESNIHLEFILEGSIVWNPQAFAGGGIFVLQGSDWDVNARSQVNFVQAGTPRFRVNAQDPASPTAQLGNAGTTPALGLAYEYRASDDNESGWEADDTSTFIQIGGSRTSLAAKASGRFGVFWSANGVSESTTAIFELVEQSTTLAFAPDPDPPPPDPPGSQTEAILDQLFTNKPAYLEWLDGIGQPTGGYPTAVNAWQNWIGQPLGITAVWNACDGGAGTTWAAWEDGNGCAYFQDVMAADSGVPDTTPIVIAQPMFPAAFGGLKGCPASQATVWANAAAGQLDSHYVTFAQNLRAYVESRGRATNTLIIRLGWEMTGTWYQWSICGTSNVPNWRTAYNRVVAILRDELPGVLIDFAPAQRYTASNCNLTCMIEGGAQPDLDFDILTRSTHDGPCCGSPPFTTSEATFYQEHRTNNSDAMIDLDEQRAVAKTYDRPIGYSEWGTQPGAIPPCDPATGGQWSTAPNPDIYIREIHDFLVEPATQGMVAYTIYMHGSCEQLYNSNAANTAARNMYKSLFQ